MVEKGRNHLNFFNYCFVWRGAGVAYLAQWKKMYLFSNPASAEDRVCMIIKTSFDDCKTWSNAKLIADNKAEYSCLTVLPDGNIRLIYEVGNVEEDRVDKGLMFVSVNPDELFTPRTLLKSDQLPK